MVYSTRDSLFTLYGNPIVWSDTSQFTADTIYLTMKNKKIDKIIMRSNSLIVVISDGTYFNQIKARNVVSYFVESNLNRMDAFGNAEVVYYAKDDSEAYVGVNKTECSEMVIRFGAQNAVEKITVITDPSGNNAPVNSAILGFASDAAGNFIFKNIKVGTHTLRISHVQYKETVAANIVVDAGKETVLSVSMQENVQTGKEVILRSDSKKK